MPQDYGIITDLQETPFPPPALLPVWEKNQYFFFMGCRWGWGQAPPVSLCCRDLISAWKMRCPKILGFKNIFYGLIEWELVQNWRRGFPAGCGWWVEVRTIVGKQENLKNWVKGDAVKWGILAFLCMSVKRNSGQVRSWFSEGPIPPQGCWKHGRSWSASSLSASFTNHRDFILK